MPVMCLIVGLGNPGREYRENRHNVGFMLLNEIAEKLQIRFSRMQSRALVATGIIAQSRIILAKPQTFMNLSGQAVNGLLRFYKLPLSNLLVAYDDLDLPIGTIRIRPDGGSAGQKGMASILERLGTEDFARLRIGIGRPPGHLQAPDYVLQDFSSTEKPILMETLSRASEAIIMWVTEGLEPVMNRFNVSLNNQEVN